MSNQLHSSYLEEQFDDDNIDDELNFIGIENEVIKFAEELVERDHLTETVDRAL